MYVEGKEIVMMSKKDYDEMSELAMLNKQQINEKAVELWKSKAAELKLTMEIRSDNGSHIVGYNTYKFKTDAYLYEKSGKFSISDKAKERFENLVKNLAYELMLHHFGKELSGINGISKALGKAEYQRRKFIVFTIIGWLMAIAMLLSTILLIIK